MITSKPAILDMALMSSLMLSSKNRRRLTQLTLRPVAASRILSGGDHVMTEAIDGARHPDGACAMSVNWLLERPKT